MNNNKFKIINSQCEECEFYNKNQNICIFYKDGIPSDIINNNIRCKYRKMDSIIDDIDENYKYYSNLYFEFFGKKAFIANPGGSKEQTIDAIKKSLIEQKDLLGEILNSNEKNIYY
jgi:hypothetical protein